LKKIILSELNIHTGTLKTIKLHDNDDHLRIGLGVDDEISYFFFRVADFEDLANIRGIDFIIESNNFIEGNWIINAQFASNKESSTVDINKIIETGYPDSTFVLANADISFLSITLTYDLKDNYGNHLFNVSPYDLNNYYFVAMPQEIRLIFNNGNEIILHNYEFNSPGMGGMIHTSYRIDMNPANYSLLNTSRLLAIIVEGEQFDVPQ